MPNPNTEIKRVAFAGEFKAMDGDTTGIFEGYGSIFGNVDSYGDIVAQGAFAESLQTNGKPSLLWQHRADMPIGVYLDVREDSKGLYVKGQLNLDTQQGRECYSLLKQGALRGLSIGYRTEVYEMDREGETRTLKKVRLYEVSCVTFPANELANVETVKAVGARPRTLRDFEKTMRDAGFSKGEALRLAAAVRSCAGLWDADQTADGVKLATHVEAMEALQAFGAMLRNNQQESV